MPLQSLRLRQTIVQLLRADSDFVAIVGNRTYGRRTPETLIWPFCRVNVNSEGPLRKGTTVRVTIHTFSLATFDDEAENSNSAIQTALENAVLQLGNTKAFLSWLSSQVIPDAAEANAWHGVSSFDAMLG